MIREYIIRASSFRFGDALPWSVISNLCDTIERELEQLDDNKKVVWASRGAKKADDGRPGWVRAN